MTHEHQIWDRLQVIDGREVIMETHEVNPPECSLCGSRTSLHPLEDGRHLCEICADSHLTAKWLGG